MTLYHSKTGQAIEVDIRPFDPADASGVLECVRAEYGDSYHREEFRTEEALCLAHCQGRIEMLVVHSAYGVSGLIGMRMARPEDLSCELISEIFKPELRGCGLAEPLVRKAIEYALRGDYTCISAHPLTLHTISQRILERQELVACGLILSFYLAGQVRTKDNMGAFIKYGRGIQILPQKKRDAGELYLPENLSVFTHLIYGRLGVDYRIKHERHIPGCSMALTHMNNNIHRNTTIAIIGVGLNLKGQMQDILDRYKDTPLQTFNAFLNINDPNAVYAYEILTSMGFYCTGFNPLCGTHEYLILHFSNGTNPHLENYQLYGQFENIREFIDEQG